MEKRKKKPKHTCVFSLYFSFSRSTVVLLVKAFFFLRESIACGSKSMPLMEAQFISLFKVVLLTEVNLHFHYKYVLLDEAHFLSLSMCFSWKHDFYFQKNFFFLQNRRITMQKSRSHKKHI